MSLRKPNRDLSRSRWQIVLSVGLCVLIAATFFSEAQSNESERIEEPLKRLRQGEVFPADMNRLAQARAKQAIPDMKEQFAVLKDTLLKQSIASALIRLGETDPVYWDFLAANAKTAVEDDAPSLFLLDSNGKIIRGSGQYSPEFTDWAKARNLDPNGAAQARLYDFPLYVGMVGATADSRGKPLLQKGLASNNFLVQAMAARGLAKLQDKESIPLIIEACNRANPEIAPFLARSLVFFDDPLAQEAAERLIANKKALQELRRRIREKGADPFEF
jgi:HEAT repeat protein